MTKKQSILGKMADTVPVKDLIGRCLEDTNGIYMGRVMGFSDQSKDIETDRTYHISYSGLCYYKIVKQKKVE